MNKKDSRVDSILSVKEGEISSWRIFRIMAEFVEGFEAINELHKAATIFGSARLKPSSPHYIDARKMGKLLAEQGYTVVTGGGPGIMEAGNRGAYESKGPGKSVGMNIELPHEQSINEFVHESKNFHHFYTRKVMLALASEVYIYCPGGFGTLDELFELLTLIQTGKIPSTPIFLLNKEFWQPLWDWAKESLADTYATINPEDLDLVNIVDSPEEVIEQLSQK